MKTGLSLLILALLIFGPQRTEAQGDEALRGALVGGALGIIIGESSSNIRTEYAAPTLAAFGALAGYSYGKQSDWRRYSVDPYPYHRRAYPYRYGRSLHRGYGVNRSYYAPSYYPTNYEIPPPPVQTAPIPAQEVKDPGPNLHPGIELVRVPVTWPNGLTHDVNILKISERFIGPQGETYYALPDAALLAERYSPQAP